MTSHAKRESNRRNAQNSTGPKTPAGKAASARNAVKHGLCAQRITISDEDPEAWADYRDDLYQHFAPHGPIEEQLVDRIAECTWRLRRVSRIEAGVLRYQSLDQRARDARRTAATFERSAPFEFTKETLQLLNTTLSRSASPRCRSHSGERSGSDAG